MASDAQLEERLKKLEERLEQLQAEAEQAHKTVTAMLPAVYTENEQRVVKAAQELGLSKYACQIWIYNIIFN
jgi:short-subunit dehydrogenase